MNFKNISLYELLLFSITMVVFGFIVSYVTDFVLKRPIDWFPKHSYGMASGTFLTSAVVFLLFSNYYIKYKCFQKY